MFGAILPLTVIQPPQRPFHAIVRVFDESRGSRARRERGELHHAPALRHVHVDRALRAPHPVVFGQRLLRLGVRPLHVVAVDDVGVPLDAREIDAPLLAVARRALVSRGFFEDLPRQREFDAPAVVFVARLVQRAANVDADLQARDVPAVDRGAAVAIGLRQQQIPRRLQRVDFEFEVFVRVAVGIDEDFEIVVLKDHRIARRQRPPDVGFEHVGGDVEKLVVPQHLHARGESRARTDVTLDVDERVRPLGRAPRRFVELAVDGQARRRAIDDGVFRRERKFLEIGFGPRLRLTGGVGRDRQQRARERQRRDPGGEARR